MSLPRRATFLLPLSLLGCRKGNTPESAAADFIDRYYIERDHAKALEAAEGGAAERVRSEQRLLAESAAAGGGVQPRVFYNFEKQQPKGEDAELTYGLTIDSSGVTLKKRVTLVLHRSGDRYKVTSFAEVDLPPS